MDFVCAITAADGITEHDYNEPTAALLVTRALGNGLTLTADATTTTITVTGPGRVITLTPAKPLRTLTSAQRRTLLALASAPDAPLRWVYSERNVPHLEHAGHPINRPVSMSLLEAGYVTGPERGHDAARTLLGILATGRLHGDGASLVATLRSTYAPATSV